MALTAKDVQDLQNELKEELKNGVYNGKIIKVGDSNNLTYYKVLTHTDDVTQGLGVVPVENAMGDNPQYDQVTIVIAGTQPPTEDFLDGKKWQSTGNAFGAWNGLTAQTQDIDDFYNQTLDNAKKIHPDATVANISGHSQAGPGTAKVGAKYNIPRIYNFQPWASKKAVENGDITKDEVAYLNEHAIVFSDSGKMITYFDGADGKVAYGRVITVEANSHDVDLFQIKDNGLDIDWYIKNNLFCSGMTKDQVRRVAKRKAADTWWDWDNEAEIDKMVAEYEKTYGAFASEKSTRQKLDAFNLDIKSYKRQLKSASGGKTISLRSDLVKVVAQKARLQAEEYATEVRQMIEKEKTALEVQIQEVHWEGYELGRHLPAWEIDSLLSQFSMSTCWDTGIEAATLAEVATYQEKLMTFADKISSVADKIVAVDKEQAQLFG